MELIVTLAVLYAAQCARRVPAGACVFTRALGRVAVSEGGGWRLLHPLPSGRSWIAERGAASLDLSRFQAESTRVDRAVRWLGPLADAYLVFLVAAPAALTLWSGIEAAIVLLVPPLAAAHLATLLLGFRVHRSLLPDASARRVEVLLAAAFYPPAALRLVHDLRVAVLGGFHAAVVGAATLPANRRRVFLRSELARAERGGTAEEERALLELARSIGLTRDALLAPRPCTDPQAGAYCPLCLADYRPGVDACADCRLPLVVYGAG